MPIEPKITAAEVAEYLGLTVQAIHKTNKNLRAKRKQSSK